jgi:PAS domain S-box-containing protein
MSRRDPVNILLVDDQPNNLIALEAMLGDMGENLIKADSGIQALRSLLDLDFAVVLLDVNMPEMDGFETARLIRQREKSKATPIIFLTAQGPNERNIFRGYSLGAVDYLFKPIVPEILRSKIAVFVDLFRKNLELREQASELERVNRQNQLILNSAAEGVIGVDGVGVATFINPAGARMLAREVHELVGKRVHEVLHPQPFAAGRCDGAECPLDSALSGDGRMEVDDGLFWRSDGSSFPTEYIGSPMLNEHGERFGAVLTYRDVTERRAAAVALENERLYREAKAANRAKDDFLATLSHELRTPMTAILGWVRMLRMGDLDPESVEMALESIERSTSVQAQLIEDILDVSRIVAGKLRLQMTVVDLPDVVERAINTVRHTADEKSIRLEVEVDQELPKTLGDAGRLQQIVWNLLTNAIKFTPESGLVRIVLRHSGPNAEIAVIDTGRGIDPRFLPFVFDRFRQENSSHTREHGGLGLGLAIVRHLVEAHGGEVRAESEGDDRGSTFTVAIPLRDPETADLADDSSNRRRKQLIQDSGKVLSNAKILVVDDETDVRDLLMTILQRSGATVLAAASAASALDQISADVDLVVSDIGMPVEDGFALLRKIREEKRLDVPVVALTAFGRDVDEDRAMSAGFQRFLRKPIDPLDFIAAVTEIIATSRNESTVKQIQGAS